MRSKGWGWKDPRNTFTLGSWLKIFPNLHVVHIYRNGIDVSRSLFERNSMLQPESKWHSTKLNDINTCFDLWETYVQQAQSWKSTLGKRYIGVRYEDLISMNDNSVEMLEGFCNRSLRDALQFHVNKEPRIKEPMTDLEALRERVRTNQTLLRLGYVV